MDLYVTESEAYPPFDYPISSDIPLPALPRSLSRRHRKASELACAIMFDILDGDGAKGLCAGRRAKAAFLVELWEFGGKRGDGYPSVVTDHYAKKVLHAAFAVWQTAGPASRQAISLRIESTELLDCQTCTDEPALHLYFTSSARRR